MDKINIICVDDEREVLASLRKDLEDFKTHFGLYCCESAAEAEELMEDLDSEGEHIGVIVCDHIMPGKNGVVLLGEIKDDGRFAKTRKLLLTGLATHQDTIIAINQASINCYIEKPWDKENLKNNIKVLLTEFVTDTGLEYKSFIQILDQETLYKALAGKV